jgi:hypothetical protein
MKILVSPRPGELASKNPLGWVKDKIGLSPCQEGRRQASVSRSYAPK